MTYVQDDVIGVLIPRDTLQLQCMHVHKRAHMFTKGPGGSQRVHRGAYASHLQCKCEARDALSYISLVLYLALRHAHIAGNGQP